MFVNPERPLGGENVRMHFMTEVYPLRRCVPKPPPLSGSRSAGNLAIVRHHITRRAAKLVEELTFSRACAWSHAGRTGSVSYNVSDRSLFSSRSRHAVPCRAPRWGAP